MKISRNLRRKYRTRNKINHCNKSGKPRIVVSRSNKNIYLQLVGQDGNIFCSHSSLLSGSDLKLSGIEKSKLIGKEFGKKCLDIKINEAVFDKGSYSYSGRVKSIADGCREVGLKF
jgi:large subunit ribosomal protein L18